MNTKLSDVRRANPDWFSRGNKRFFGDVRYWLYHDAEHNPYLVRATYAFTDMFGGERKLHYRINPVDAKTLEIGQLVDTVLASLEAARDYIKS